LNAAFSATTHAQIFKIFKEALAVRIGNGDPTKEIEHMGSLFNQMRDNRYRVSEKLCMMILINALLLNWGHVVSLILNQYSSDADFTWANITQVVKTEYTSKYLSSQPSRHQKANKVSAIKRQKTTGNPWRKPNQQTGAAPSHSHQPDSQKRQCAGHGKQGKGKGQQQEQQVRLADTITISTPPPIPSPLPSVTISPKATSIVSFPKGNALLDRIRHNPQSVTGTSVNKGKGSVYSSFQKARELATELHVPSRSKNLKRLEELVLDTQETRPKFEQGCLSRPLQSNKRKFARNEHEDDKMVSLGSETEEDDVR
jgi:hypothetical protein